MIKKVFCRIMIVLGVLFSVLVIGALTVVIRPQDPIVLTQEEEIEQDKEQIKKYSDVDLKGMKTVDLNGKVVTDKIFKKAKVTMINIWTTSCGPCIEEMPDINEVYKKRPKDTNIISILVTDKNDVDDIKRGKEIMEKSGVDFKTLIPDNVLKNQIADKTNLFPTNIFVDSNGKIIDKVYLGGRSKEDYTKALNEKLEQSNNK